MLKFFDVLRRCALFDGIGDEELKKMLTCLGAKTESYCKKNTVFSEGIAAKNIGIVLSGSLQTIQFDYYGNRSILSEILPSEIFAEEFACAELDTIPVSVIANENTDIMLIDCAHILHTCHNNCAFHQRLIFNMMKNLALKNLGFYEKIEVTAKRTTREKLLCYLIMYAKKCGKKEFDIPFDRQELADYLQVERSGLSAEIGKMRREGIIKSKKNHFVLI